MSLSRGGVMFEGESAGVGHLEGDEVAGNEANVWVRGPRRYWKCA